jgi:hypothetical protein
MENLYQEDVAEQEHSTEVSATSVTSGRYLTSFLEAGVDLLRASDELMAAEHSQAFREAAVRAALKLGFYANASLRQVHWETAGVEITTGEGVRFSGPITWFALDLGSIPITTLGDVAAIAGRPPSLEDHVGFLRTRSWLNYARELADRLIEISTDLEEDEEDPIKLSDESVGCLISFLEAHPMLSRPRLAPTAAGFVVARWENEDRSQRLNIFFLPGGAAQYYLSTPNRDNPSDRDWDSGATTIASLPEKLARHRVWGWMEA